jgi:hypothetical protein
MQKGSTSLVTFVHSAAKGKPTDSNKLYDARHTVNDGVIAYLDVPR